MAFQIQCYLAFKALPNFRRFLITVAAKNPCIKNLQCGCKFFFEETRPARKNAQVYAFVNNHVNLCKNTCLCIAIIFLVVSLMLDFTTLDFLPTNRYAFSVADMAHTKVAYCVKSNTLVTIGLYPF